MNKPIRDYSQIEKDYRKADGLNYSLLADFKISPRQALKEKEEKAYFVTGKALERLLQDKATGSNLFGEKFFVADLEGEPPEILIQTIGTVKPLWCLRKWNKRGKPTKKDSNVKMVLSDTYKTLHQWIDVCEKNPGLLPISQNHYNDLLTMVDRIFELELFGLSVKDILVKSWFQEPIFWKKDGILKKALLDFISFLKFDSDITTVVPGDIKTTADLSKYKYDLRKRGWIQAEHYLEGTVEKFTAPNQEVHQLFFFIVVEKKAPFNAGIFYKEPTSEDYIDNKPEHYQELVRDCHQWLKEGKPEFINKEPTAVKVY